MPDPTPAAGWYSDPGGSPQRRYWDGSAWGDLDLSGAAALAAPLPSPGYYPDPSGSPYQRYWDGATWGELRVTAVPSFHAAPTDPYAGPSADPYSSAPRHLGDPGYGPDSVVPSSSSSRVRLYAIILVVVVLVVGAYSYSSRHSPSNTSFCSAVAAYDTYLKKPPPATLSGTATRAQALIALASIRSTILAQDPLITAVDHAAPTPTLAAAYSNELVYNTRLLSVIAMAQRLVSSLPSATPASRVTSTLKPYKTQIFNYAINVASVDALQAAAITAACPSLFPTTTTAG